MNRLILFAMVSLTASCSSYNRGHLLPHTETVLTPGMTVTATNANGTVRIYADGEASRVFSGEGWEQSSRLIPRETRWYGSLGLYDPAASFSPHGRLLVDEGKLFFSSQSEALRYLYVGSKRDKPVFTNRGLVFGFSISPIRDGESTRSLKLWQIYINGKRPTSMRGADDSAIVVAGGSIADEASPNPAPVGYIATPGKKEYRP